MYKLWAGSASLLSFPNFEIGFPDITHSIFVFCSMRQNLSMRVFPAQIVSVNWWGKRERQDLVEGRQFQEL